jgi:hypothetical protein
LIACRLAERFRQRLPLDAVHHRPQQGVGCQHEHRGQHRFGQQLDAGTRATAADPHSVAAVFRPDTCAPSFMIAPAPRKPTPEIT